MMKTKTHNEALDTVITTDVLKDADGNVVSEDITCETSTRLPTLRLADNDDEFVKHTCEGYIPDSVIVA